MQVACRLPRGTGLEGEQAAGGLLDLLRLRQRGPLEPGFVGYVSIGGPKPRYGRVQVTKTVLTRPCRHFGAEAACQVVLGNHEQSSGAGHGLSHQLFVPRHDRAEVDDFDARASDGRRGLE